jgi:hypothetical protein
MQKMIKSSQCMVYLKKRELCKKMIKVANWDEIWHKCRLYAENEFDSTKNMRARRGQTNEQRIKHQTAVGKMGEYVTHEFLSTLGYECTEPDCEVYTGRKKSWASDLFVDEHKIAVKTQDLDSAMRFGKSWIFQKGGYGFGHTDPVIDGGKSFAVFVTLDLNEKGAYVNGPYDMKVLRSYFKDPKVPSLRFSKTALYWEDIKNIPSVSIN